MSGPGRLIVLSGPSGSGKTTICKKLLQRDDFERIVTCTTRAPRGNEKDGVDYRFLSREEFERGIREGRFIEHAEIYGELYGSPRDAIESGIERGKTLLLNIDVQGARQIRESGIDGMVSVFIDPPSLIVLEERLRKRGTDTPEAIRHRLDIARKELEEKPYYDHVVVNAKLDNAVSEVLKALAVKRRNP